jgi:hypothetical protein
MSKNVLNTPSVVLLPIVLFALAVCCSASREADAPRTGGAGQTGRDRACGGLPYFLDAAKTGAQAGDPMYMSILSERYACGAGVQQNMAEAFRWAMDAAEKDYTPAMYIVGGLYEGGHAAPAIRATRTLISDTSIFTIVACIVRSRQTKARPCSFSKRECKHLHSGATTFLWRIRVGVLPQIQCLCLRL